MEERGVNVQLFIIAEGLEGQTVNPSSFNEWEILKSCDYIICSHVKESLPST
jgi:hypothetical protein